MTMAGGKLPGESTVEWDIESRLLDIFGSVLRTNQFTGYFPLSFDTKNGIQKQNCSFPLIWSVSLTVAGILGGILILTWILLDFSTFQFVLSNKHLPIGYRSSTEEFVNVVAFATGIAMSIWFKINAIHKRESTVAFWKENCLKLQKFTEQMSNGNGCSKTKPGTNLNVAPSPSAERERMLCDLMTHVKHSVRKYVRVASICAVVGFLLIFGLYLYHYLIFTFAFFQPPNDQHGDGIAPSAIENNSNDIRDINLIAFYIVGSVIFFSLALLYYWIFFLHFSHSIYLSTFLKVYQSCLRYVGKNLKDQVDREYQEHEQRTNDEIELKHEVNVSGRKLENIVIMLSGRKKVQSKGNQNKSLGLGSGEEQLEMNDYETKVDSCMKAYSVIEDLIDDFNDHFKWEILAELLFAIIVILMFGFFVLFGIKQGHYNAVFFTFIPMIVFALQLFVLGSQASLVAGKAQGIIKYFHLLALDNYSLYFQVKILMISNKILNGPPQILPGAFVKLDRYLLTSILSALATYLIVLIQFRGADEGSPNPATSSLTGCNCTDLSSAF